MWQEVQNVLPGDAPAGSAVGRDPFSIGFMVLHHRCPDRRVLVVDLETPGPDLVGVEHTQHLGSEAGGLRQRLAVDSDSTTVAAVLPAVAAVAPVRDDSDESGFRVRGCRVRPFQEPPTDYRSGRRFPPAFVLRRVGEAHQSTQNCSSKFLTLAVVRLAGWGLLRRV